jgi:hypothetical protein
MSRQAPRRFLIDIANVLACSTERARSRHRFGRRHNRRIWQGGHYLQGNMRRPPSLQFPRWRGDAGRVVQAVTMTDRWGRPRRRRAVGYPRDHCASSSLTSAARYGGTGAASASYCSLNDRPIAISPTYRSGAGFALLGVAQGTICRRIQW